VIKQRDPYKDYRAQLLSPEEVKMLSRLSSPRVIVDTCLCWAVILAAWTWVALFPQWWVVLLTIPVIGARYYALFIIAHDGLHSRLFENKRINNWFNDTFIIGAIGAITRINNKNHLLHHLHLSNPEDPDRHKHACFNKAERPELLVYLAGLSSVLRSVKNVFLTNARRKQSEMASEPKPQISYTFGELAVLILWQAVLIGGLTYFIGWWAYPVLWLLPVYAFTFLADNLRSFAEHSQPESDQKADEHRLITYLSNPVERFFLAPMNMNFHAAHHLWVSIPYYNLPLADRRIRRSPQAQGLEWRGSYISYLLRYYLALPLEECKQQAS
jgi:fatty acid desaturase